MEEKNVFNLENLPKTNISNDESSIEILEEKENDNLYDVNYKKDNIISSINKATIKKLNLLKSMIIPINKKTNKIIDNVDKDNIFLLKKKIKYYRIVSFLFVIVSIILLSILLYIMLRPKFKNLTIEYGTEKVLKEDFLVSNIYLSKNIKMLTDARKINYKKKGKQVIELSYKGKKEKINLSIEDNTAPKVKFQNIEKYTGYKLDPNDFIVSKEDLSQMTVSTSSNPILNKYGDYKVNIMVIDSSGNITSKICTLTIGWLRKKVTLQLNSQFSASDFVVVDSDKDKIPESELQKINISKINKTVIKVNLAGKIYKCNVEVVDTLGPELEVKNIFVYDDDTRKFSVNDFVANVSDNSGTYDVLSENEIDYNRLGEQIIKIRAIDQYGNETVKEAIYSRNKDTSGPVFKGVGAIVTTKNSQIDYYSGVSAYDDKDGICDFSVDSSGVDVGSTGTFYATYRSSDKSGNVTTFKRKIIINHDHNDVNTLVAEIANQCGASISEIHNCVQQRISYSHSWGGDDPVWYGLTNWSGNCYVHARVYDAILRYRGYTTQLIWVTNQTHYWNMIFVDGKWYHSDTTPDRNHRKLPVLANDNQRLSTLSGRTWDRGSWPGSD